MMTQEEYMDLLALKGQGLTVTEIAAELGYHPATVAKWLAAGGPPARRAVAEDARVLDARWQGRIDELVRAKPKLLAKSIFEALAAEGFTGSYATVVRYVRTLRGPRFRAAPAASVPIETAPGEEAQFDWSDCTAWARQWGWDGELWCLGVILSWSRWRRWWFASSIDRHHTFEGLLGFVEAAGGVPAQLRTDRMGALGSSQGKRFSLHPPTLEFCRHLGVELRPCAARDAKRKGKVERPFRDLKETFLEEVDLAGAPASVAELNARAAAWVERRVHGVAHRTTGVAPAERMDTERRFLAPLPARRFDTDYVETRRVHVAVPVIEWRAVRYSVEPDALGQRVEVRQPVGADEIVVRWAGVVVASHRLAGPGVVEVWDPEHRRKAEAQALAPHRRHLRPVPSTDAAVLPACVRLELDGDYDIETPDLGRYGAGA